MDKATSFLPTLTSATALVGVVCGTFSYLLGGWDVWATALFIAMAADFISGLAVAGVFKKSKKSKDGTIESRAIRKGLSRKGKTLLIVFIAVQIDQVTGSVLFRDGVIIA